MKKNEEIKKLVEKLKEAGISLTEDQVAQLAGILEKDFSYVPKIGVFGKTGAGKSSFVNAIFGQDVCPVSDVEACTRDLQEANVGGIILVDCPGIAESAERDEEYKKMYTELIPKLDAIIWVLKGDDRSYGPDLDFYELIKHCFKTEDGNMCSFVTEGSLTDDFVGEGFFGCGIVFKKDNIEEMLRYMCENGYRHHVAITKCNSAKSVEEAFKKYLDYKVDVI